MATTLQEVRDIAYAIIKQPSTARAYPPELMDTFINKAQNDICYGTVTNLQTGEKISKVTLPFLDKYKFYTSVARTSVETAPAIGDTTLSATTTGYPTSGYLYVMGNKLSYTGVTATSFTGIPATGSFSIQFAFEAGTSILPMYAVPTDFSQATLANYNKNQRLKNLDQRDIVSPDSSSYYLQRFFRSDFSTDITNMEYYYSIIDAAYLIFLIPSVSDRMIRLDYQAGPTQMSAVTDECTIPDAFVLNTVPYFAAAEMMANRGEMNEAIALNMYAFSNTANMYKYYQSQKNELMY